MALAVHRSLRLCTTMVLMVIAFGAWPILVGHGSPRARAENWVRSQSHLPVDLDAINEYPQQYQQVIYERLTPEAKHRLWQEFLRRQAAQENTGSPRQRRFLVSLAEELAVDDFRDQPMRTELRILTSEAKVILGSQFKLLQSGAWQQSSFGAHLRDGDVWDSLRIARLHAVERLYTFVTVSANPAPCNCWVQESGKYDCPDRPGYYKYCAPDVDRRLCTPQGDGYEGPCGLYDTRACNGACYYAAAGGGSGGGGGGCDGDCCSRGEGGYCDAECDSCQAH